MASRRICSLFVALLASAGLIAVVGFGPGLLFVLPAIVMAALLAWGWFPGEETLARVREARARRPRRLTAPLRGMPRARRVLGPRGGTLLGAALAGRAPPSPASA